MEKISLFNYGEKSSEPFAELTPADVISLSKDVLEILVEQDQVKNPLLYEHEVIGHYKDRNWKATFGGDVKLTTKDVPEHSEIYYAFFLREWAVGTDPAHRRLGIVDADKPSQVLTHVEMLSWLKFEGDNSFSFRGISSQPLSNMPGNLAITWANEPRLITERLFIGKTSNSHLYKIVFRLR